ncbi:hypothetical protein BamMEX5DRAFT_7108 [Burkholderia ambifaria MEX-5]|uniref:BIG2 domain-containing protein n=1 Tax=Burkholderia ambifaria MEX-5 TaxID=396597 RepID=B1TH41_9BURK|nr:hypothetical protein BamMEX5DRAFT_7108 [Burkholderia ambifaria MEX-5]
MIDVQLSRLDFGADVTLNAAGYHVGELSPPTIPPPNATYNRVATGGGGPYTYASSDIYVAQIDHYGTVRVCGNGTAQLTATDSEGAVASHQLTVTGVTIYRQARGWLTHTFANAVSICTQLSGQVPSIQDLRALRETYREEPGGAYAFLGYDGGHTWSGTNNGPEWIMVMVFSTGAEDILNPATGLCHVIAQFAGRPPG